MGRASNLSHPSVLTALRRGGSAPAGGKANYREFVRTHLAVHYLSDDEAVRRAVEDISRLAPTELSVDFETSSKNGRWGAMNGSISLIQLGVDEPGIAPQQWLIDCQRCNPRPLVSLLENSHCEKLVHYLDFELEWARIHLGARTISPLYDTCIAWQVIQKKLKALPEGEAQLLVPGWEKHPNKLGVLVERYLELDIPKADQASDWGRRPLAAHQIVYAATDVAVLHRLSALTHEIAARAGVSDEIAGRIRWVKHKVHSRVGAADAAHYDDHERVLAALGRTTSRVELDAVWQSSRQMTLSSSGSEAVRELYEQRCLQF